MLLPELLANGAASMLYASLVRDRQVLTGIEAFYDHLTRGDTLLTLYAYSNPDKGTPQQAIEQIRHILDAVRQAAQGSDTRRPQVPAAYRAAHRQGYSAKTGRIHRLVCPQRVEARGA
jgi:predicted Zn-dependent peptidase